MSVFFSMSLVFFLFFFSLPVAALSISFLLSPLLLSVFIKMKGSFDVRADQAPFTHVE